LIAAQTEFFGFVTIEIADKVLDLLELLLRLNPLMVVAGYSRIDGGARNLTNTPATAENYLETVC